MNPENGKPGGFCRNFLSVRTGTPVEASNPGLQVWALAIYLLCTHLKGQSSMKLHRDLDVRRSSLLICSRVRPGGDGAMWGAL